MRSGRNPSPASQWRFLSILAAGILCGTAGRAQSLLYPGNGVICDPSAQVCYDAGGPSLPLTARRFGDGAADRLARQLGRAPTGGGQWLMGNGVVCSTPARKCWKDGWRQEKVSRKLTDYLFGY